MTNQTVNYKKSYYFDFFYFLIKGKGKFYHITGDIYEGDWSNGKANGEGIY